LLTIVSAGYSITAYPWGATLGWTAGVLAVLTAYVRVLGGALGLKQDFCGPMSKPVRIAVLAAACLVAAAGPPLKWGDPVMAAALLLIAVGSLATALRRTVRIVRQLEAR